MRLRGIVYIGVSSSRLHTSQLHRQGSLSLPLNLRLLQIKRHGPVVHIPIADIRLRALVVRLAAKDTPMDVVPVLGRV